MSENLPQLPPGPDQGFRPSWFLGGVAIGLAALAFLGRQAGRTDYHPDFIRLVTAVTPEDNYYPTVDELCSIVRTKCSPDQVLVIVGGNSILAGVWQPAAELWSEKLQADLGPRYAVVNLAFRGSEPTDGGAVIAEALRREYPRQIYVANEALVTGEDTYGSDPYRFLFWQAYFSGRLMRFPIRDFRVREYLLDKVRRKESLDIVIRELADRVLRFHDLWNRIGYEHFFTVPNMYGGAIPELLAPRRDFPDEERDVTDPELADKWYPPSSEAAELAIVRGTCQLTYEMTPGGVWEMTPATRSEMHRTLMEAFPDPLKGRTLILISRSSPHYISQLTPLEQAHYDQAARETVAIWKDVGYPCIDYGRDFGPEDFGDRTHLSKFGGKKLADLVAVEIREIAVRRGYLK